MPMVCVQPENRADHAQCLYVQRGDRAGLAHGVCVGTKVQGWSYTVQGLVGIP